MEHGRKLPYKYENPIDSLLIMLTEKMNPVYRKLGMTPNILTTISMLTVIFSVLLQLYSDMPIAGAMLYFVAYYFDCADGNFARKYGMSTRFGDIYDHVTDFIKMGLGMFVLWKISTPSERITTALLLAMLSVPFFVHMGCQERIYKPKHNEHGECLHVLKQICPNTRWISYTRWFGCGTIHLLITLLMILRRKRHF